MRNREVIIACVATLILVGLVAVHSSTAVSCGANPLENAFFRRQATWALISFAAMVVFANIDYHSLARRSHLLLLLTFCGLLALLALGTPRNGARRWFSVGPVNVQVAEFAKIAIILYIAHFASRKKESLDKFQRGLLPPLVVLGATFGLIVLQPDFGTAVLILTVGVTMLIVAGIRWIHVLLLTSAAAPVLFFLLRMREYRWRRLIVFLDPWSDPQGAGYHVVQSLIALGSGGLTGVGTGRGLQKLGFLPEAETDFIFATFGQEHGFVGCVLLLFVYIALVYAGLSISRTAMDMLGALLAVGVTVLIGLQMLINVGVATSSVPTKGISLPFVSLGGSSALALSIGVGILLNVSRHSFRDDTVRIRGATRGEVLA